jgi:hypothetical protein
VVAVSNTQEARLTVSISPGGSFVRIAGAHLDVPLFWQSSKLDSPMVKTVPDGRAIVGGCELAPAPDLIAAHATTNVANRIARGWPFE